MRILYRRWMAQILSVGISKFKNQSSAPDGNVADERQVESQFSEYHNTCVCPQRMLYQ